MAERRRSFADVFLAAHVRPQLHNARWFERRSRNMARQAWRSSNATRRQQLPLQRSRVATEPDRRARRPHFAVPAQVLLTVGVRVALLAHRLQPRQPDHDLAKQRRTGQATRERERQFSVACPAIESAAHGIAQRTAAVHSLCLRFAIAAVVRSQVVRPTRIVLREDRRLRWRDAAEIPEVRQRDCCRLILQARGKRRVRLSLHGTRTGLKFGSPDRREDVGYCEPQRQP